jgi:hypothetical protein
MSNKNISYLSVSHAIENAIAKYKRKESIEDCLSKTSLLSTTRLNLTQESSKRSNHTVPGIPKELNFADWCQARNIQSPAEHPF